jgi:YidC/Oxa1 family membrane protein insertase
VEKRWFIFIVLSILIWLAFLGFNFYFNPPKPQPPVAKKDAVKQDKIDNKQAEDPADKKPERPAAVADSTILRRRVTLGSLDPTSPYALLVTFDNAGAAIERIEFNDRFHDLDDRSGYLGHLALTDAAKGGAEVNVVGPGTPAAAAGLQVGDVITAVEKGPIHKARELQEYLEKNRKPEQKVELEIDRGGQKLTMTATLIRRPLELIRPEDNSGAEPVDKKHKGDFGPIGPPSYRLTLSRLGEKSISPGEQELADLPSLHHSNWKLEVDEKAGLVTFTLDLATDQVTGAGGSGGLALTKTYRLGTKAEANKAPAYHLDLHVGIKNTGDKEQKVAYRLEGPNGLPLEGWWYSNKVHPKMFAGAGARDIRDFNPSKNTHEMIGNPLLISDAATQIKAGEPATHNLLAANDRREFEYLAVDAQYFASALLHGDILKEEAAGKRLPYPVDAAFAAPLNLITDKKWARTTNVTFFIDSESLDLKKDEELTSDYVIFAGPKDADILATYRLGQLIEYGWFPWVVIPLKKVLHGLYYVLQNYGIAIILLTCIVRACLVPFSIRQAKSAAMMQAMAPEMAKLKEKYPDDALKQSAAQRELMKKYGVNPMGGCLLMFAQLPIFIGLYRCLATDIDLREAALLPGIHWASNLAGPDELFRWKQYLWQIIGDEAHGWLGPYCNILPLITIALFMVQQKLFTPPAVTEEQQQQQKIMNFMTIFMGVMFYKVPAGLCIYFIMSSLWGICERKLLPKPKPGMPPVAVAVSEKPDAGGGSAKKPPGAPGFLEKLMGLADAQLKESKSGVPRKKAKK